MASYLATHDKSLCTGCSACAAACSHQAISMQEDDEGFLFPVINTKQCIGCHLCEKVCPVSNGHQSNSGDRQQAFIAISDLPNYYLKSATIGFCTMLAQSEIIQGGKVFGVYLDETNWKARHQCAVDQEGIENFRNSKYIQSDPGNTFKKTRELLNNGSSVTYIGTPCEIAGLKAFLRKDYSNLLTIDLICHGTYSYKLIQKEVSYWEHRLHGKVHNFRFRSKKGSGGIINFDLKRLISDVHYEFPGKYSPTYRCFAYSGDGQNYNLRTACYSCPFRDRSRTADITVGDAWFIDAAKILGVKNLDWKKGVSLILANTLKGNSKVQKLLPMLKVAEIPTQEAFVQPALLPTHREIPSKREELYKAINTSENYAHIVKRLLNADIEQIFRADKHEMQKKELKKALKKYLLINKIHAFKSKWRPGWEWWFTNSFLCNFPSKRFRNLMLKRLGMTFLGNARIYTGFHIRNPKGIIIEDGVSIGPKVLLDGRKGLTIKKSAVIGYGAIIWTLNHDYNDIHFCGKGAPVTIGPYAWVCSNSIILPGISIGEGAVVASGAIVTHDVPPYTIVGGIPAKVIGQREKKDFDYGYNAENDKMHFC